MTREERIELDALKARVSYLELRTGVNIGQEMCAGYCHQPTNDPGGMCELCREVERRDMARRRE